MYTLSRMMLTASVICWLYCAAIFAVLGWPGSMWIIGILVLAARLRRRDKPLTTLGSARWADEDELRRAGMIGGDEGMIIGRLPPSNRPFDCLRKLLSPNVSAKEVCMAIWSAKERRKGSVVRLAQSLHVSVYGPSGAGKGVSCILPFAQVCSDSMFFIDFKGEAAKATAQYRAKKFGHRIVLLDLYRMVTQKPDRFNPLASVLRDSPTLLDDCNDLAKAIVSRSSDEREPHWNDSAEMWISSFLAAVAQYGDDMRNLQTVCDLISDPQKLDMVLRLMRESTAFDRLLARQGGWLSHCGEKERSSVLTTVSRHLSFLNTPAVAESTSHSTFDFAELCSGKTSVYCIIPPDRMRACSGLLRMWISSALRAIVKQGAQSRRKIHFIFDEMASVGHLECVDDLIDKYRAYGVHGQFYFQSPGQAKLCFPNGQDQTLSSNTTQVYFNVTDFQTAEAVSAHCGESTIIVESGGSNRGYSSSWSQGGQPQSGGGTSDGISESWQQQARKLVKPEEVLTEDPRIAYAFVPGMRPLRTRLLRYYEEKWLTRQPGIMKRSLQTVFVLMASATVCALSLAFLAALTLSAKDMPAIRSIVGPEITPWLDQLGHF